MPKLPWFKFYFQEWRGDSCLSQCCAETRGAWIDLITVMYERGAGKLIATLSEFARLARVPDDRISHILHELKRTQTARVEGDFSAEVVLISRRITREMRSRKFNKDRQERMYNANITRQKRASNGGDTRTQIPDTRIQTPEEPPIPLPPDPLQDFPILADYFPLLFDQLRGAHPKAKLPLTGTSDWFEWRKALASLAKGEGAYPQDEIEAILTWLYLDEEPSQSGFTWRAQAQSLLGLPKRKKGDTLRKFDKIADAWRQAKNRGKKEPYENPEGPDNEELQRIIDDESYSYAHPNGRD